ncbi:uncharacterized protein LOC115441299 [Manduca sexta]|uniref:uncharacterized protein LOC115441299 n=1 Tax=Manduca sexta TaxID=7130 RepID=UPI0011831137|nr:uncharacterized protein LOC115441299 [Manduca sexta]
MLYILFFLLLCNNVISTNKFGPYQCLLVKAEACKKPTKPVVKDSPMLFHGEIYNTTKKTNLLKGNLTVTKEIRIKKINIKAYYWEFGRWNTQYIMNNMGCNSVFLPMVVKVTQVKLNTDTCKFLKGSNVFQGLDVNEMQHVWMSTQEYGRIMWLAEFFSHAGSIFCWEFETVNKPA